ncbi:39S ribosomal protein L1, mitochondrial [Drosophila guanche]|uniref:Large ribosomal subunit protein uL1m n=1 Tax=Drosophila guanche TaxID=7266 RepID=A0A3B0JP31_DROGU|nr:39S ribosomal protein L1, mitochondrial [Drosophila guanche]SPP82673.1 blast:39S ribosomal protein L1%2C mitochondrial [Drosophila guanche]
MQSILSSMRALALRQPTGDAVRRLHLTAISEAARKGTREKARKKKVKVEVKKVGFIPHNQRDKKINVKRADKHVDDSWKQVSKDDVYVGRYYRWPVYSVAEAIQCHRETHHPSMYNVPNAPLNVEIELNMQGEKATRFVDNFQRMAMIPHKFEHGEERKIIVFTKGNDEILEAREAGASLVGGVELIKDITGGELLLSDYQFIIAHPNILPELVALRGLMKRKFPNPKSETLGANLAEMIVKFSSGISYSAAKDEYQQNFGLITASVGPLDMDAQKLEENLKHLLQDVNEMRPKREGRFITRVLLKSPPSSEQLKIDPFVYVPEMWDKSSAKVKREEAKKQEEPVETQEAVAAN